MIKYVAPENIIQEATKSYSLFETEVDSKKYRMEFTPIGNFKICYEDSSYSRFERKLPVIPNNIYFTCLLFFSEVCNRYNTEAALQLFFNLEDNKYFLYLPEQVVKHTAVQFERNHVLESTNYLVADIHSHGEIAAFFSSVDDADELGTRLFFVFGGLKNRKPEAKFRAGSGGHFTNLEKDDIFDVNDEVCLSEVRESVAKLLNNAARIKF